MTASFYEEIAVDLELEGEISPGKINRILRAAGATLDYDVYSFDRKDRHPIWQSESFASVELLAGGRRVDAQDAADIVRLVYPMARIPSTFITRFVELAATLSQQLNAKVRLDGVVVSRDDLLGKLDDVSGEIMSVWGEEPGSENLAIMIEQNPAMR